MTKLAEYTVDGIGVNSLPMSSTHGKFIGYVSSTGKSLPRTGQAMAIPQRESNAIVVNLDNVKKMQQERNERLGRMENGGSYWS